MKDAWDRPISFLYALLGSFVGTFIGTLFAKYLAHVVFGL